MDITHDEGGTLPLPEPPISGDGLLLRPWCADDAAAVAAAGRDPLIVRFRYSLPSSPATVAGWLARVEADRLSGERLELAITTGDDIVGSISLTDFEHGNAMVRYWLLPAGRGRGLATHAVRHLAGWAFADLGLGLGRLAAYVEPENVASQAVLSRCGFVSEGRLRRHMAGRGGRRVDSLLYGLLPEDLSRPRE